jgi:lysophospholipase
MASESLIEVKNLLPEMEVGAFVGTKDVEIVYAVLEIESEKGVVVIVNGRNETLVKYRTVISELTAAGYSVYSFDHRGQGFSERLLVDPHKGHVDSFADYVADLHFFLENIVKRRPHNSCLALAHSMGATITLLHELRYPGSFAAIAMTAPMLGFSTAPWPFFLVPPLLSLYEVLGLREKYVVGGGPFKSELFTDDNFLTSDRENYNRNQQMMLDYPRIQLGSPTCAWVQESLRAIKDIMAGAENLRIPLLILQAESDRVVNNRALERFCHRAGSCELLVIPQDRHEILMEKPKLREIAGRAILEFFASCD